MKKYVKLILMSLALCLTLGVMVVGIYSATSGSSVLSSMVKWNALGVEAEINAMVSGNNSSDSITNTYHQTISASEANPSGTWSIGSMNFVTTNNSATGKKTCTPIVIRFSIKNIASDEQVKLYYKFATPPQDIYNLDYTYRIAYGTLGASETWNGTDFFSSSYSGNMTVVNDKTSYTSIEKYSSSSYLDNGETAVFEISMVVNNLSANISSASLTPVLTLKSALTPTLDKLKFIANSDGNSYSVAAKSSSITGEVIIPETYEGKPVTSIANSGFADNSNLTSVIIPNSVTSIGDYAFNKCIGLTSIMIPNSVTSIGVNVFSNCSGLTSINVSSGNTKYDSRDNCNAIIETASNTLIQGCKTTIIPDSVISIGVSAFSGCSGLTSITIPNSVTRIGNSAFNKCIGLTSITIPNSVTSIGVNVFSNCSGLTSINVSSGNTKYDSRDNCNAIIETASNTLIQGCKTTIIPDSVISIGVSAFYGCSGLTSITIPNSVTDIKNRAFSYCDGLTSIIIPDGATSIGSRTFLYCEKLTKIYIPASVTTISASGSSNSPFYGCSSSLVIYCAAGSKPTGWGTYWNYYSSSETLTVNWGASEADLYSGILIFTASSDGNSYSVKGASTASGDIVIPASIDGKPVTTISSSGFANNTRITEVVVPEGIREIGSYAFTGCVRLNSINFPNSLTTIGYRAFYNTGLQSVYLGKNITSIGGCVFSYCPVLRSIQVDAENQKYDSRNNCNAIIETSSNKLMFGCAISVIPDSVTSIGDYAFSYCYGINSFNIPNNVTSIGNDAFSYCVYLNKITIPGSVLSIGEGAFDHCSSLTDITIEEGVQIVNEYAFTECVELLSLTLPSTVTTLGKGAVYGCVKLTNINLPIGITVISEELFGNCSSLTNVTIPSNVTTIEDYAFKNSAISDLSIADTVTTLGAYVFEKCSNLTTIVLPNSITTIGEGLFSECTSLKNVTFPNSLSMTTNRMFRNCSGLIEITIPNNITSLADYTFMNCSSLINVNLPSTITKLGKDVFYQCTSLVDIVIPDSVTNIGDYLFSGCTNLMNVTLSSSITRLSSYMFENCTSLESFSIPDSITKISNNAFKGCTSLIKVFIPQTVINITVVSATYSPFYGCSSGLKLYCEVASAPIKDSLIDDGWSKYWNYYDSTNTLSVTFGVTRSQYNSL